MMSRGRRVAWACEQGQTVREKPAGDRTGRKEEVLLVLCVHASCPQQPVVSCALGALHVLLPGLDTHPSTPCPPLPALVPTFLSHLQLLSALGKARCPIPPPDTPCLPSLQLLQGAPRGWAPGPSTDPYPSGYLLTVSGRNQGGLDQTLGVPGSEKPQRPPLAQPLVNRAEAGTVPPLPSLEALCLLALAPCPDLLGPCCCSEPL